MNGKTGALVGGGDGTVLSGLGTMQVPRVARGASRLCFCRVVLRDTIED
jgi:hypothetical protein